jgi:aspartate carbamoyltransferase catalytic subunit
LFLLFPILALNGVCFPFCPKDDIKDYLNSQGVEWEESSDLLEVASQCDVIYQTRIQKERFGERIDLYEAARSKYIVDKKVLDVLPKHAVIMHPLPRLDEVRSYPYKWNSFHSIHAVPCSQCSQ